MGGRATMTATTLTLRFLGETEVVRGAAAVPLPPSKKTRALLAWLAVSGGTHRRERLCSLLWDVTDDPRGALRWSLSKLRAVVDEPGRGRIAADRETVAFQPHGAQVDLLAIRARLIRGTDSIETDALQRLAAGFRGEFLEGLDLSDFHDFHAWCVAMREDARRARATILQALVRRLEGEPERALPFARALVQAEPFAPAPRLRLLELLAGSGRLREAEDHYATARRILGEAGPAAAAELDAEWKEIHARARTSAAGMAAAPEAAVPSVAPGGPGRPEALPLVGRGAELDRLQQIMDEVTSRRQERAVLLLGEPGIGKSRLLGELTARARARGGLILEGRCYEAESGRPYGPWAEALRRLPTASLGAPLAAALGPLLGDPAPGAAEGSRERLMGAVSDLVAARAAAPAPLLIAFDDAQWCDAASAELLHYVARLNRHRPVLLALAAREGELMDNDPVRRLLRGLRTEGIVETIHPGPLSRTDVAALVGAITTDADVERVFGESGGNPLFAAELARMGRSEKDDVPPRLFDVVRDRIDRLPAEPAEVLRWAAVLGASVRVDCLSRIVSLDAERLVTALETLERHELLDAPASGVNGGRYSFSHDVLRRVVYADLSEPRRRVMHARIARALGGPDADGEAAAAVVHHATLAGDADTAATACVEAGRRWLRLFAAAEAWALSRRGAQLAKQIEEPHRTMRQIELLEVGLSARRPQALEEAGREVEALAERALDLGCAEHARRAFHLLGWLRWEEGDSPGARRHLMQAEAVSRSGGERERAVAMGEAARCLALLEKDLGEAEALAREAWALAKRAGTDHVAIADALGMLRRHEGRLDEAAEHFRQARSMARRDRSAMDEFLAIEHLAAVELERGEGAAARRLAEELVRLGGKLREGSELPFARALEALCRAEAGEPAGLEDLPRALDGLRAADAKQRLAFLLLRAARLDLTRGDAATARSRAQEALALAAALHLASDAVLARALLAQSTEALGDEPASREHRGALADTSRAILSAAARLARDALIPARRDGAAAAPPRRRMTR